MIKFQMSRKRKTADILKTFSIGYKWRRSFFVKFHTFQFTDSTTSWLLYQIWTPAQTKQCR